MRRERTSILCKEQRSMYVSFYFTTLFISVKTKLEFVINSNE